MDSNNAAPADRLESLRFQELGDSVHGRTDPIAACFDMLCSSCNLLRTGRPCIRTFIGPSIPKRLSIFHQDLQREIRSLGRFRCIAKLSHRWAQINQCIRQRRDAPEASYIFWIWTISSKPVWIATAFQRMQGPHDLRVDITKKRKNSNTRISSSSKGLLFPFRMVTPRQQECDKQSYDDRRCLHPAGQAYVSIHPADDFFHA